MFSCLERWPRGLKRRIANPLYNSYVPRVRIPLSPLFKVSLALLIEKLILTRQLRQRLLSNPYVRGFVQDHLIKIRKRREKQKRSLLHRQIV